MDAPRAVLSFSQDGDTQLPPLSAVLDADPRPVFLLRATPLTPGSAPFELVFHNRALANDPTLLTAILDALNLKPSTHAQDALDFRNWIDTFTAGSNRTSSAARGLRYCNIHWNSFIVNGHFQVVSGNLTEQRQKPRARSGPAHRPSRISSPADAASSQPKRLHSNKAADNAHLTTKLVSPDESQTAADKRYDPKPPPTTEDAKVAIPIRLSTSMASDWTAAMPVGVLSAHEVFARQADWAATPLGPMSSWSPEFREVVNLLMRNPHPASLFWGQELTMIYNEAYSREVAGNKHPGLMGSGFVGPFAELWESVRPIFQDCARTGKSVRKENDRLLIERFGYLEETFFSWSWTPLYGGTDRILGFYNAPFETTHQTVSSRRMETLRQLGERVAPARSTGHFWRGVLAGLEFNPYDICFATLYSMTDVEGSDAASTSSSSTLSSKQCNLEGTIGVPPDHAAAIAKIDLTDKSQLAALFRDAVNRSEPLLLRSSDRSLPEMFLSGIEYRGFGIPPKEALFVAVRSMDGLSTLAILTLGLNPRRIYDDDYKSFITMLTRQLTTSLASLLRMEDEKRQNRTAAELAALQQERLTQELALQTSRLRRMTERSPLGMFLFSPDGVLLEANEPYYRMTDHPRDHAYEMSFLDILAVASQPTAQEMWRKLTVDRVAQSEEIQLKHNYNTEINEMTGMPIDCWVLGSVVPEIGQDGNVRSVMGSIIDISHMKWSQVLQDQRLREAEEGKRQQNAFIDITSHEMRNPMSAVLICADEIKEALEHPRFKVDEVIRECLEAVNTIALCVQHQKSIVDDILTISKLNSNLLVIAPTPTQPIQVVQQAMKMFKNEAQAKGIEFSLNIHQSLRDLEIDWVMLDPGRLLQITVNLITNAIKFTQQTATRQVTIYVGASLLPPTPNTPHFEYIPTREPHTDVTTGGDWGEGELLYLRVKVADTGCGLTTDEKQRLFQKFSQASPRTHAQYGGSGLGLFISRQLAELHGGQIGAASQAGHGSTFGFFIQCRRMTLPPSTSPAMRTDQAGAGRAMQVLTPEHGPHQDRSTLSAAFDPRSLHVLVVEDNIVNQKLLRRQLQKIGCSVQTADNGLLALNYLETTELRRPDGKKVSVILMDLEMPEMDGLTCVAQIRHHEASGWFLRRIPVIAVTANVRTEQVQAARESGMDAIVSKPFRIPELLARIESVVGIP